MGYVVGIERQNYFQRRFGDLVLAGSPDLIPAKNGRGLIIDCKSGVPRPQHTVQVMTYMASVPAARSEYAGIVFEGLVRYRDGDVHIPASAIDETFMTQLEGAVLAIGGDVPLVAAPSVPTCARCDIPSSDCPFRVDASVAEEAG